MYVIAMPQEHVCKCLALCTCSAGSGTWPGQKGRRHTNMQAAGGRKPGALIKSWFGGSAGIILV